MCRLLLVQSKTPFDPAAYLEPFADACRASPEYQGHGWGLVRITAGSRHRHEYKSIAPIWHDNLAQFGSTRVLLAHARSAFRDEDIAMTNNMPFVAGRWSFAFNGEVRGVRVRIEGRTGAARIWQLIQRVHQTGLPIHDAVARAASMIEERSEYVRALNLMVTDGARTVLHSTFNESPEYFTLHQHASPDGRVVVTSSEPFDISNRSAAAPHPSPDWRPIENRSTLAW